MSTSIFISLPVKDVKQSTAFYKALGWKRNPQFSDDNTSCFAVSDTISVMLASHEQFKQVSPKPMADPTKGCQVLLSLSLDSRESVDEMVAKAMSAGGSKAHEPEDYGFMYQHAFYDLEGHGCSRGVRRGARPSITGARGGPVGRLSSSSPIHDPGQGSKICVT